MTTQNLTPTTASKPTPQGRPTGAEDPPTFLEVAGHHGWQETADRINRWSAAGYAGDWWDAIYDLPNPADVKDGAP